MLSFNGSSNSSYKSLSNYSERKGSAEMPKSKIESNFTTTSGSQKAAGLFRDQITLDIHSAEEFLNMCFRNKRIFLDSILKNDVKAGFLLAFCDSQYCSENSRFVVAVNRYNDCFEGCKNFRAWEQLDKHTDNPVLCELSEAQCKNIERELHNITESFLTSSGKYEICISPAMLERTRMRMENYKVYGPQAFKEAIMDPINTLMKDILPRFVVSQMYDDMRYFIDKINNVPFMHITTLELPHPFVHDNEAAMDTVYIENFDNYFTNPLLYDQLLKYLNKIVSSENLLCVRAIDMFSLLFGKEAGTDKINMGNIVSSEAAMKMASINDIVDAERSVTNLGKAGSGPDRLKAMAVSQAWLIYLHFLAANAPLEVCTDHFVLQNVAQSMAAPSKNMFKKVRSSCIRIVQEHFYSFKSSPEYAEIPALVAAAVAAASSSQIANSSCVCTIS